MELTIQDVIDRLTSPVEEIENSVDTLKFGSPSINITGIAITFMPSNEAIKKAIELGANLLITHEGLFYSHWDENNLGENQVYTNKLNLLKDSGIAVYRFHDYWHRYRPDGIMTGLVESLEWDTYVEEHQAAATILTIPTMTAQQIAEYVKKKIGIDYIRCIGDLSMSCTRIGLLAGYRGGGSMAIPLFENQNLDLILYGEGPEWETPEYVHDAIYQGKEKALIVLGHAESEEPGMKYLAKIIDNMFPSVPIHFIPTEQRFRVI
ncbi:Nif3-like dinuclear metal center hexameric protein [Salipaludibacillus sp. HK11]|uniref:Nif3-like dinuclear metal center hexameric protein n=1 Tax=Salipaludibacillus sp. HK11 TaxID=3394320 RepID=UPI0039FDC0CA